MNADLPSVGEVTRTDELNLGIPPKHLSTSARQKLKRKRALVQDLQSSLSHEEDQSHVDTVADVQVQPVESNVKLDSIADAPLATAPQAALLIPKEEVVYIEEYHSVDDKIALVQPAAGQVVYDDDMHLIARAHLLNLAPQTEESLHYAKREEEIRELYADIDWVREKERDLDDSQFSLANAYNFYLATQAPSPLRDAMQAEVAQRDKAAGLMRHRLRTRERHNFLKIASLTSYQRSAEHQVIDAWERTKKSGH